MKIKVLIDKSVLLSSSVFASVKEIKSPIEHEFYQISARLMNNIEENREFGYITYEVENESRELLGKAIRDTIEEDDELPSYGDMDALYVVSAICNEKMEERIMSCNRVSISREDYEKYIEEVRDMYLDLITTFNQTFQESPSDKTQKILESSDFYLDKSTIMAIKESMKDPAFDTLLRKIIKQPAEKEDKKLLSQAIYLSNERFEDSKLLLASCDQHFVKVRRAEDSPHDSLVSSAIENKFGIECMWPDEISQEYLE